LKYSSFDSERVFVDPFTYVTPVSGAAPPTPTYQVRTDAYSASLITAQPMSLFSELGMTSYTQSIDGLIRTGNINDSYLIRSTGSAASYVFQSASVVDSGSGAYDWSSEGYTSSISQENSHNVGVIRTADYNIGSQNFVVEGWFKKEQTQANPPFNLWIFGSDASGDYLTIQNNTANVFTFFINANNTWSTTPTATLTLGQWYHIAYVKSGTNAYVYLNGNRIGVGTRPASVNNPPSARWELVGLNSGNNNDGIRKNVQDYRVYIGTDKGYTGATITIPESIVELV
jgi:hypothetical protein